MRIDPILAQLRRDPAPQLRAQTVLEAVRNGWFMGPEAAPLLDDLDRYGAGAAFAECRALGAIFSEPALARRLIDALVRPMIAALRENPLGHVPLRHQFTPGLMILQLAGAGRAALSLICYEARPSGGELARTVCFAGGERRELCLAGAAEARVFEILHEEPGRADLDCDHRLIGPGDVLTFAGGRDTKLVDRARDRMAMLRLSRSDAEPLAAREYRIADGVLVHRASGDRAESRDEMAAAVLGAMGRADAAPVLAGIAREPGSDHFRWQALCQALALDTASGFGALGDIAASHSDALAPQAGALRASLIERHPVLASWSAPCPAS